MSSKGKGPRVKGPRSYSSDLELSRTNSSESTSSSSSSSSVSCSWFGIDYCECCYHSCNLRRRPHIRRQHRRSKTIKPLPKVPATLAAEEIQIRRNRIRRLPNPPEFPPVSPTTCTTPMPILVGSEDCYPNSPSSGEIDWEILINEIISPRFS